MMLRLKIELVDVWIWHLADARFLAYVRFAPMNETARAVGRCGVGRGRANNGWSDCRVGFSPTGKRRLCTAHANNGHYCAGFVLVGLFRRPHYWCIVHPLPWGAATGTCRGPEFFNGSVEAVGRHRN